MMANGSVSQDEPFVDKRNAKPTDTDQTSHTHNTNSRTKSKKHNAKQEIRDNTKQNKAQIEEEQGNKGTKTYMCGKRPNFHLQTCSSASENSS